MDSSYVVALVYSWLEENPSYYSTWVRPHRQLRYNGVNRRPTATRVGGHYRHRTGYANMLARVALLCKFERLSVPRPLSPPTTLTRARFDENGYVPRAYRIFVWA